MRPRIRFGPAFAQSMSELQSELSRLAEEAAAALGGAGGAAIPIDLTETREGLHLDAELAGVHRDDLDVAIEDDVLHLHAERRPVRPQAPRQPERRTGPLARSIKLPFAPAPDQVQARYENGLLSLFLPRPEGVRGVRVEVKG